MVVLTDGSNVMGVTNTDLGSNYSSFGYLVDGRLGSIPPSSTATNIAMNERTLAACTYAKENGIEFYTIRLEEPDVKTGTMLQECTSTPAHYFDAPSRRLNRDTVSHPFATRPLTAALTVLSLTPIWLAIRP